MLGLSAGWWWFLFKLWLWCTLTFGVLGFALWKFLDVLLTQVVRRFGGDFVDTHRFCVEGSWPHGRVEICHLALMPSLLKSVSPSLGLPLALEQMKIEKVTILAPPLWRMVFGGASATATATVTAEKPLTWGISVRGTELALSMDAVERWMWNLEDNLERFQQSTIEAATNRHARANAWTNTVISKLLELKTVREALRKKQSILSGQKASPDKQKQPVLSPRSRLTANGNTNNQDSVAGAKNETDPTSFVSRLFALPDRVLDAFFFELDRVSITIRDDTKACGIGITMERFAIEPAKPDLPLKTVEREVVVQDFLLFVNPVEHAIRASPLIKDVTLVITLQMPIIFQELLIGGSGDQQPGAPVKTRVSLDLTFKNQMGLQIRPAQIQKLLHMYKPYEFFCDWWYRASILDELSCVELTKIDQDEYQRLYAEDYEFITKRSFVSRLWVRYREREALEARKARLEQLESKLLPSRIVELRCKALKWSIPKAGVALPHVDQSILTRANLRRFEMNPVSFYVRNMEEGAPFFGWFDLKMQVPHFELELLQDSEQSMLKFVVADMDLTLSYSMAKVDATKEAMTVGFSIRRFLLSDERNSKTNVFTHLLDRNQDAVLVLNARVAQLGSGHFDVKVALQDFSLIVVFDPLLAVTHEFLPSLEEDLETEMRYLSCDTGTVAPSPEKREETMVLFEEDLPPDYSPLMLGGMSLSAEIEVKSCELCLLGDSSSLKSHVLAFTSDVKLVVRSSSHRESVDLELVDVALQPCTIDIQNDAIYLDMSGLRTILELEGEGVDLELRYIVVVASSDTALKSFSASKAEENMKQKARSTSSLWGIARKGVLKKEIVEMEHLVLENAEELSMISSQQARVKPSAKRKFALTMSDFGINLSSNDLGVFISILSAFSASIIEDEGVVRARVAKEKELADIKKEIEEKRYMERLKAEFIKLDVDGGGSLDASEVEVLLKTVTQRHRLTKEEFDQTLRDFIRIVDKDGSGDISYEEFVQALNREKINYYGLHVQSVSLTAQEYVDPKYTRDKVPYAHGDQVHDLANINALNMFWRRYEEQTGASRKSLNGQEPLVVQRKMIRAFRNFEYAQEAWNRLVNPVLIKPAEKSPWLVTREMVIEGRGNVIDELLSSFNALDVEVPTPHASEKRMFVHTVITTSFGGFYLRLIDDTLPLGTPSIELSLEELTMYANFSMWEGELPNSSADLRVRKRAKNNFGVGRMSFKVYGKYYNPKASQMEPFLEYYHGILYAKKDPESHLDIVYSSDQYFQLNVTAAFMEVLNGNIASFSRVHASSSKERSHIKEEGGLFWMKNESGIPLKYFVVAKKQKKDVIRAKQVSDKVTVLHEEAVPCILMNADEEMQAYEQQSLKEKQLRQAFKNADVDGSEDLTADEVRQVLLEVWEDELSLLRSRQTLRQRSESQDKFTLKMTEDELNQAVEDFIELADTDRSGEVSWEEFKAAIAKSRQTVNRYITVEIDGFEPIEDIPLVGITQTQVHELVPKFDDVTNEKAIGNLYRQGIALLTKDNPTQKELQKAYACFRKVLSINPNYEWIDSYYAQCLRSYLPVVVSLTMSIDRFIGLQVVVSSATCIRNATAKTTQCLLVDADGKVSPHNPEQEGYPNERFYVLPPHGSISVPIDLVDVGSFSIRQVGETEWSNFLPLTVREQRHHKHLTRYEQELAREKQRSINGKQKRPSGREENGNAKDVAWPTSWDNHEPGDEILYPSKAIIDNQPTLVTEKISQNDLKAGVWNIVIQPQLVLQNLLPCAVEYALVQTRDCPVETLDSKGHFRFLGGTSTSKSRHVKILNRYDYFEYVDEVNSRKVYVESGKSVQVFGLDLDEPCLLKVRMCSHVPSSPSQRIPKGEWCDPFVVRLQASREKFNSESFELRFGQGPSIVFDQVWDPNSVRNLLLYVPYWIQNRSGLDLLFKIPKGRLTPIESHREYFGSTSASDTPPLLAMAPLANAELMVKPYKETPAPFEDFQGPDGSYAIKKYLPLLEKLDWSEPQDVSNVGTQGEFRTNSYSFVLAYEILAAPSQFYRTRIVVISPRYVFLSKVRRPLQVTPVSMDKKARFKLPSSETRVSTFLREDEALVVYRFIGAEKHQVGLRLRDAHVEEGMKDVGEWCHEVPLIPGQEFNVWSRTSLGDGPVCNISMQNNNETIYAVISDISKSPRYRIENRSSTVGFRYIQYNSSRAEDTFIQPLESHTFVWDNPLAELLRVKVIPMDVKVPSLVDFMEIGHIRALASPHLHGEVYLDGSTRVLAIGDTTCFQDVRQQRLLDDWLSEAVIDIGLHGVGITVVDAKPKEIMNLTMENLRLFSPLNSRDVVMELHHFQIDDMTPESVYPIVFCPLDSGFNSDKRESWLPDDGERPFFSLKINSSPQTGITLVNDFDIELGSMAVKLNLEYLIQVGNLFAQFVPASDEEAMVQSGIDYKNTMLSLQWNFPSSTERTGMLLYFKEWILHAFEVHLVFDSVQESKGEGITAILGSTLGSIIGGIAHVTPEFKFNDIEYRNQFFYEYDLLFTVIWDIVYSVIGQWYKIVGSVELLGDPIGLANDIIDGFALAGRQIKRDFKGKSRRKGEAGITLLQTVVGAPFNSLGKVSNGLGDLVKKGVHFESQEEAEQPKHLGEGMLQSGIVLTKSLAVGMAGLVAEPVRGAKHDGFKGFAKGVGLGTLQLVASPVVGTLGAVEKFSQSINNTTHLLDDKPFDGTRRPPRSLDASPLKTLAESNVITELELHVLHVENIPERTNAKVYIRVYNSHDGTLKETAKFKTSTIRHSSLPMFDQSWLVSISSLETIIEFGVYHKRKPRPKKRLGFVRFTMEDIYRNFDSVPAKLLGNQRAKAVMKRRKGFRGSILHELAKTSRLEHPDETWRQSIVQSRVSQSRSAATNASGTASGSSGDNGPSSGNGVRDSARRRQSSSAYTSGASSPSVTRARSAPSGLRASSDVTATTGSFSIPNFDEAPSMSDLEDGEDDYDRDVAELRSLKVEIDDDFEPKAVPFDLENCKTDGRIFLSIRYVNDMRRHG